ncbi:AraC family transcriptional regulator [Paraburkholderia tropica]|uniref:AraC family transcriptional regulator n=1 Tax=Paraburkholderia tropica TaxID=92647 RepID=UPI001CB191B9|nr:AraC family transcriptional regulator [Paraburkholderia tropica]CAG9225821.1 AraC family transcriptional regulator [Paraburkholderia tropica]
MISRVISAPVAATPKDNLGCVSSKLRKDIHVDSGDITFYRKCMEEADLSRVTMPACERGFLTGISLGHAHRRKIFTGARTLDRHFDTDSIYIRDFSEDYQADMYGNFDFVLIELSRPFLDRLADEQDLPAISGLTCDVQQKDAVLGHLARALAANLELAGSINTLFVEQIGLAIGSHVARQYGSFNAANERAKGALSAANEARAKELLLERSRDGVSIADIARECNLSRGYFIRAFSKSTGRTPHQWLLEQRTDEARQLVERTDMTLSEIAAQCGFADQSHLSRVFLKLVGVSPGAWRRHALRAALSRQD